MNRKPKIFSHATFDVDLLLVLAERIHGQPCHCDSNQRPMTGSMNWAIALAFADGVEWIFRSPLKDRFSDDFMAKMIRSEVITTRLIISNSDVPVPKVFSFCADKDNEIGVPYILQSKASGTCLLDYSIREATGQPGLAEEQRAKVMQQLRHFTLQLASIRFPRIGSLTLQQGTGNNSNEDDIVVGGCLAPALTWGMRYALENLARGPFDQDKDYFDSLAEALSLHAQELPMEHHALLAPVPTPEVYESREQYSHASNRWNSFVAIGSKIDHSRNRFAYCMAAQVLQKTIIPQLVETSQHGYPLMHPDLHVGNIFVDDNMQVTSIIDWSCTTTVPEAELFGTPRLWENKETQLTPVFREGMFKQPDFWTRTDKIRAFQRLTRLCASRDYDYFAALMPVSNNNSQRDEVLLDALEECANESHSQTLLQELQADDPSPDEVAEHEKVRFREADFRAETDRIAVARKLTVMWEMNPRFVADKRLWNWLYEAFKVADTK